MHIISKRIFLPGSRWDKWYFCASMFRPKLLDVLRHYDRRQFNNDLVAGIIVGIVALPLAIAFAIASGVSPEKGLYTAVIAGFLISALGGSRVQIGGPTGAFIVIVFGIVQVHGVNGLILATMMAGVMLVIMGFARLGSVIKFIPYPLITGFTSGIAVLIFSSQVKDFLGLRMGDVPAEFIEKWIAFFESIPTLNWHAVALAGLTVLIIQFWPRITHRVPGSLVAIFVTTFIMQAFNFPVETIGSKFGEIPSALPMPVLPDIDLSTIRTLVQPAFTIALLGGIESLLSAVVADGMIGGNHRSNTELVAQGTANIFSSLFGGIPATGAIARTATNVKNGGRTPVAGMVHALTLLLIMVFAGRWASYIPMATLAGILVVVAYNMSEIGSFIFVLRGPGSDAAVLLTSFILTVLVDLTVAIEIGMVLAVFLFMRKMIKFSDVSVLTKDLDESRDTGDPEALENFDIPKEVEVFEITGPLFFGATYKFREAMKFIEKPPKVLIVRMRHVPIIDATGIKTIEDVYRETKQRGTRLILAEVHSAAVMRELSDARLLFAIGKGNVKTSFRDALERSKIILGGG